MMQVCNDISNVYKKSIYTINLFFVHLLKKGRVKALQIIKTFIFQSTFLHHLIIV